MLEGRSVAQPRYERSQSHTICSSALPLSVCLSYFLFRSGGHPQLVSHRSPSEAGHQRRLRALCPQGL